MEIQSRLCLWIIDEGVFRIYDNVMHLFQVSINMRKLDFQPTKVFVLPRNNVNIINLFIEVDGWNGAAVRSLCDACYDLRQLHILNKVPASKLKSLRRTELVNGTMLHKNAGKSARYTVRAPCKLFTVNFSKNNRF